MKMLIMVLSYRYRLESWGFRDFRLTYDVSNIIEIEDVFEYLISLGLVMIIIFIWYKINYSNNIKFI